MANTVKLGESAEDTELGERLIEGLGEALAWRRGEISLPVGIAASMTPDRIKAIRNAGSIRRRRPITMKKDHDREETPDGRPLD